MREDYCSLCEEVRIIGYGEDHKPMVLAEHREHHIELSSGSLLCVGVCMECKASLAGAKSKKNADKILEGYKTHLRALPGYRSEFESLSVVEPNTSESDYRMKKIREGVEQKSKLAEQIERAEAEMEAAQKKRLEDESESERRKKAYKEELKSNDDNTFYD